MRANNIEVTKKPSLISWPRTDANKTSQKPPTKNTTIYTGSQYEAPSIILSHTLAASKPAIVATRLPRQPSAWTMPIASMAVLA